MKPKIINIQTHTDDRGYFKTVFSEDPELWEVCISHNRKGAFRGLHMQTFPQAKYIHVLKGEIIDLVYNRRADTIEEFHLSENDGQVLYIPQYLAHGFFAKTDAMLLYGICENPYYPNDQVTYSIYDLLDIDFPSKDYILKNIKYISQKDKGL